eukprot:1155211-Pelagomonas_calceolata.AAC.5
MHIRAACLPSPHQMQSTLNAESSTHPPHTPDVKHTLLRTPLTLPRWCPGRARAHRTQRLLCQKMPALSWQKSGTQGSQSQA